MQLSQPSPSISVLMPVRNAGRFLAQALQSILTQNGITFEVIVVDDGSDDDCPAILENFSDRYPGLQIVHRSGLGGISRSLNQAIELARGKYIARMDADDVAIQGRLAAQFRYLEQHPEVGVLGTQAWNIDESGKRGRWYRVPTGTTNVRKALETSSPLIHPTVMMRRELVLSVGGYRPMFDTAEDYDLWLRLSILTELDNLDAPFLLYRRHTEQQTVLRCFKQAHLTAIAQVSHCLRLAGAHDPLEAASDLRRWRTIFGKVDPYAIRHVRLKLACSLADNGGSLSATGMRCLRCACWHQTRNDPIEIRRRLALASVRHQLQLIRAKQWGKALQWTVTVLVCWRWELFRVYIRHFDII